MSPDLMEFVRLAPLGFLIGAYGTLVGAGGGALLVPALLLLMPGESPATVTSISLAVVFFNAYSGTVAYARMRRIDYFAGVLFALAGLPGAVLGTVLVRELPRQLFDPLFGVLLLVLGVVLAVNPLGRAQAVQSGRHGQTARPEDCARSRTLLLGCIGSAYIAVVSSVLGIGGGIIHVPFLIRLLRFPPHVATATSHFVLTVMALTATLAHVLLGELGPSLDRTMYLAVGVMMGAPIGAAVSSRVLGSLIVRLLAGALCLVGLRLVGQIL
jgi:hypothetical protein